MTALEQRLRDGRTTSGARSARCRCCSSRARRATCSTPARRGSRIASCAPSPASTIASTCIRATAIWSACSDAMRAPSCIRTSCAFNRRTSRVGSDHPGGEGAESFPPEGGIPTGPDVAAAPNLPPPAQAPASDPRPGRRGSAPCWGRRAPIPATPTGCWCASGSPHAGSPTPHGGGSNTGGMSRFASPQARFAVTRWPAGPQGARMPRHVLQETAFRRPSVPAGAGAGAGRARDRTEAAARTARSSARSACRWAMRGPTGIWGPITCAGRPRAGSAQGRRGGGALDRLPPEVSRGRCVCARRGHGSAPATRTGDAHADAAGGAVGPGATSSSATGRMPSSGRCSRRWMPCRPSPTPPVGDQVYARTRPPTSSGTRAAGRTRALLEALHPLRRPHRPRACATSCARCPR